MNKRKHLLQIIINTLSASYNMVAVARRNAAEYYFPKSQINQPLFKNLFCKLIEYPD